MRHIKIILLLFVLLAPIALASSGYIEPCGKNPFSISYSASTNKLYSGCAGGENYRQVIITDPVSLNVEKFYPVDGLVEEVIPISDGNSILVLLADLDHSSTTEDGVLRQIAYSDGHTEHEFAFSTIPLGLAVDSQENYAYVTSGLNDFSVNPIVTKINLSTWQKVGNDVKYGKFSNYAVLSNDDSKLYVKNEAITRKELINEKYRYYFEVGVFNTSNMSALTPIEIEVCPSVMARGYDNRIYVSSTMPDEGQPSLLVINTNDNTVIPLYYENVSFEDIALDADHCKLYCVALTERIDPAVQVPLFDPSNMVYQIDLENNYSFNILEPSEVSVALIEAAPLDDPNYSCRIFATELYGKKIYYLDVQ